MVHQTNQWPIQNAQYTENTSNNLIPIRFRITFYLLLFFVVVSLSVFKLVTFLPFIISSVRLPVSLYVKLNNNLVPTSPSTPFIHSFIPIRTNIILLNMRKYIHFSFENRDRGKKTQNFKFRIRYSFVDSYKYIVVSPIIIYLLILP